MNNDKTERCWQNGSISTASLLNWKKKVTEKGGRRWEEWQNDTSRASSKTSSPGWKSCINPLAGLSPRSHHLSRKKGRASLPTRSGPVRRKNFPPPCIRAIQEKGESCRHSPDPSGNSSRQQPTVLIWRPTCRLSQDPAETAAGNTPSSGTTGGSQLTTDKTENRQTGNSIKT